MSSGREGLFANVTEVMVNGPDDVYVERVGRLERAPDGLFEGEESVRHLIERIVGPLGLRVDESSPWADARLPDGSRVHAIVPPLSLRGPTLTIRKFSPVPLRAEDLVRGGTAGPRMLRFLETCVRGRANLIVSGGAGSGKTTLLGILSAFIPDDERLITIEDAAELRLAKPHVVSLEARPANVEGRGEVTVRDLVRNALRMRPDRIIVGEVRGGEALDMLQAMNTGHDGSLSTAHANSVSWTPHPSDATRPPARGGGSPARLLA
jgi:pilus assembly protein CpaF